MNKIKKLFLHRNVINLDFIVIMTKSRNTRNSKKVARLANRARKISRNAFLSDLCKGMYDAYVQNDGRLPYRHLENIHREVKPDNE